MTRRNRVVLLTVSLGLGGGLGYAIRATASGIPSASALTYAGVLEDASGPITGGHNVQVILYDAATAGNNLCQSTTAAVSVVDGHFSVQLPDACTTAVGANPNVWADVLVDGNDTGRTKIGAVPYAVEANHAVTADNAAANGALSQLTVPSGAVMAFNLSACPPGWSAYAAAEGRTVIGVNPSSSNGLSVRTLGGQIGEEQHALTQSEMPSHTHTVSDSGHSHGIGPSGVAGQSGQPGLECSTGACGLACPAQANGAFTYPVCFNATSTNTGVANVSAQATGGGLSHNNMQPSVALLYCVKS